MKFGLYLKRKGVLSADALVAALEFQQSRMPPVGQLAMEEGVLSARQVFQILRCQSDLPHERFGDVAVGMGLMLPGELRRLLMIQWERKPLLADVMVALRMLSRPQVDHHLASYRAEMERRNVVVKHFVPSAPRFSDEGDSEYISDTETLAVMY